MLRIERGPGRLEVVTRLARPRVLAVLAAALGAAAAAARAVPAAALALGAVALLVVVVGGRTLRARFERGRVRVPSPVPLWPGADRPLADFAAAAVETVAEARRRKAERHAAQYRARSGAEIPTWLRPGDARGANDHLRRIVLLPRAGAPGPEPLAVTAWLADDDLEAARAELDALLR